MCWQTRASATEEDAMAVKSETLAQSRIEANQLKQDLQIESPSRRVLRRFLQHRLAVIGSIVILLLTLMAIAAPLIAPIDPLLVELREAASPPNSKHWLGTDAVGRDVWSRVVYAIRVSLSVGIVAVGISVVIALLLGTLSGYFGGWVDMLIMRLTDIILCIPSLVIIMSVVVLVGPSIYNIMIVIGLLGWTGMARLVRGQILSARDWEYVIAARCVGAPDSRIMVMHILPNVIAPMVVAATFGVASAILTEAGLSFLGFGVMPPTPSWGNMLNAARSLDILRSQPWFWLPPGIMILITVLSINFIGDGLRDALDPRMTLK
jgi:peptide/nickel transport system permease protein